MSTSRTGNPYKLPTRVSFWRDFLQGVANGMSGVPEDEADIVAEVPNWGCRWAEEVASVVYECLISRGSMTEAECIVGANDSADRWLDQVEQLVDAGKMNRATLDSHRAAWSRVEVSP